MSWVKQPALDRSYDRRYVWIGDLTMTDGKTRTVVYKRREYVEGFWRLYLACGSVLELNASTIASFEIAPRHEDAEHD